MSRKVYRESDQRILSVVDVYDKKSILDCLKGIAHNFESNNTKINSNLTIACT